MYATILITTISTIVYGAAGYIKNDWGFYLVSIVARLFQGVADAILFITVPSVIVVEYHES